MNLMSLRFASAAAAALMALSGLVQAGLVQSVMADEAAPFTPIQLESVQLAQSGKGGPQGGRPPREAFEACQSKAANDSCQVTLPDGNAMTGTCQAPPQGGDGAMACVPAGGPKPRG
ncbi:hypothetical protein [uncultured Roseibium sp.]|uniref:hypothetical protein n=1 Tax=uncultured Roseibium sp. TaxID=1936171 RepID=UPI002599DACA|nr:hypothetical protein [uncultured Roseibium sp.]